MKLPEPLAEVLERLRTVRDRLRERPASSTALSQFLRPNLGPTPEPLRRFLEPLVALGALTVLVSLLGVGALSFATLFLVAGLMYAILTYVFGLELGLSS